MRNFLHWRKLSSAFLGFVLGLATVIVVSETSQAERLQLPLGRNLETGLLEEALKVSPEKLISFIEAHGVRVYLYPSRRPKNPQFSSGQAITSPLKAEPSLHYLFEDSGGGATVADVGMFIPTDDEDLGKYGTFIVIAESATSHTLLHEFIHALFYRTETPNNNDAKYSLAGRTFRSNRNLMLQFGFSFRDLGSSDLYKRDNLVETLLTDIQMEADRIRWFAAEEVLVEKILASKIDASSSPYFTPGRIEKGASYAASNIRGPRVSAARYFNLWAEIKHGFMRVAGNYPSTSVSEREEIIVSVPNYEAQIKASLDAIVTSLDELEAFSLPVRR